MCHNDECGILSLKINATSFETGRKKQDNLLGDRKKALLSQLKAEPQGGGDSSQVIHINLVQRRREREVENWEGQ